MTTPQIICLAAIAALVIIYVVGQLTRPRGNGDGMLKAVTTAVIMAKEENRYLSIKISDHSVEVFCGNKLEGNSDEPQKGG